MKDYTSMMTTEHSLLAIHVSQKVNTTSPKAIIIIIIIITDLENYRVYQSTFRSEISASVNSKFTCCSQALKFGSVLSKTFA